MYPRTLSCTAEYYSSQYSEVRVRPCSSCGNRQLSRLRRVGLAERFLLPALGLYPWNCRVCGNKQLRFKRRDSANPGSTR